MAFGCNVHLYPSLVLFVSLSLGLVSFHLLAGCLLLIDFLLGCGSELPPHIAFVERRSALKRQSSPFHPFSGALCRSVLLTGELIAAAAAAFAGVKS